MKTRILSRCSRGSILCPQNSGVRCSLTRQLRSVDRRLDDTPIAGFKGGRFIKRDVAILKSARQALIRGGLDRWIYYGNAQLTTGKDAAHAARQPWTVTVADTYDNEGSPRRWRASSFSSVG